jgi:hypothetical protein
MCAKNEDSLRELKYGFTGNSEGYKSHAPLCEDFKRKPPGKYIGYSWEDENGDTP